MNQDKTAPKQAVKKLPIKKPVVKKSTLSPTAQQSTSSTLNISLLLANHPEFIRRKQFIKIKPMQSIKEPKEILEVLAKENIRLFYDLSLKMQEQDLKHNQIPNLDKIKFKDQLMLLYNYIESNYAKIKPWNNFWTPHVVDSYSLSNISDQKEKLQKAKFIFQHHIYLFLPRHLRYALVRFIASTMIEIAKPYEPIDKFLEFQSQEEELKMKDTDCQQYLGIIKSLIEDNNNSDVIQRSEQQQIFALQQIQKKEDDENMRLSYGFQSVDLEGNIQLKMDIQEKQILDEEEILRKEEKEKKEKQNLLSLVIESEAEYDKMTLEEQVQLYNMQKLDYYILKVKYELIFKDLEKCRKRLYKLDQFIRNQFQNNIRYRTEFLALQCKSLCQHKEILAAHYILKNWSQHLDEQELDIEMRIDALRKASSDLVVLNDSKLSQASSQVQKKPSNREQKREVVYCQFKTRMLLWELSNIMESVQECKSNLFYIFQLVRHNQNIYISTDEHYYEQLQSQKSKINDQQKLIQPSKIGPNIINYVFGTANSETALQLYIQETLPKPKIQLQTQIDQTATPPQKEDELKEQNLVDRIYHFELPESLINESKDIYQIFELQFISKKIYSVIILETLRSLFLMKEFEILSHVIQQANPDFFDLQKYCQNVYDKKEIEKNYKLTAKEDQKVNKNTDKKYLLAEQKFNQKKFQDLLKIIEQKKIEKNIKEAIFINYEQRKQYNIQRLSDSLDATAQITQEDFDKAEIREILS